MSKARLFLSDQDIIDCLHKAPNIRIDGGLSKLLEQYAEEKAKAFLKSIDTWPSVFSDERVDELYNQFKEQ